MKSHTSTWPELKRYRGPQLERIGLPLGGIGTGTISLGGRGNLFDWEVMNRPAKGFTPKCSFLALYAKPAVGTAVARALEGPIADWQCQGATGVTAPNCGLPRFRNCTFAAAYPLGQVLLSDPLVPVDARIEAFNPLIPGDADASGIPVAILRIVLNNKTRKTVTCGLCASMENFIPNRRDGGSGGASKHNVNEYRVTKDLHGILCRADGADKNAEDFGTLALATIANRDVTYRTAWADLNWGDSLLDFWDDFTADGALDNREQAGTTSPQASLAVRFTLPARAKRSVTFLIAWHFPNRQTWTPRKKLTLAPAESCGPDCDCHEGDEDCVGNYYATQYADAWDVALRTANQLPQLEAKTVQFVSAVCGSDFPNTVKEAALFNLASLRSQSTFRTADGRFFGWEGCNDTSGCCHGSCSHVWNYDQATPMLFGQLSRSMREVQFGHATDERGHMRFRVDLPLGRKHFASAAADGQMGTLMNLYRDWQLSGDDAMLKALWPNARKAMEFAWIPRGWDADRDGVMEGCQHNTMDVEYYGPNPHIGVMYLGALRACQEMADYLGESDFAQTCGELFHRGRAWIDANLFNGEYYEQHVRPIPDAAAIAPGLRHETMGARNLADPDFQIACGCEVNQLFGAQLARILGLGHLLDRNRIGKALRGIVRHNFRSNLYGHFNHLRGYAVDDEGGLLICTWPRGGRPRRPFPYANEIWTGLEYMVASHLFSEKMSAAAQKIVAAVRARHDGRRRNPFDEAECGHHYVRALSSWGMLAAISGFHYSAVSQTMHFNSARRPTTWFWSTGSACGTCRQKPARRGIEVQLAVIHGELRLRKMVLTDFGEANVSGNGKTRRIIVSRQ